MDDDVVAQSGDYRVKVVPDEDGYSADPRGDGDGDLIDIVTPTLRSYDIRSKNAMFQREHDALMERGLGSAFGRYLKIFHNVDAWPVYMYDHSAISLSTGSFIGRAQHAEWDSGQIGWAYIRPDAQKWEGMDEEAVVSGFVETLGQWINGEVYGYVLEKNRHGRIVFDDADEDDLEYEDWDEVDSCWGIIGYDWAETEGKQALQYELEALKKEA